MSASSQRIFCAFLANCYFVCCWVNQMTSFYYMCIAIVLFLLYIFLDRCYNRIHIFSTCAWFFVCNANIICINWIRLLGICLVRGRYRNDVSLTLMTFFVPRFSTDCIKTYIYKFQADLISDGMWLRLVLSKKKWLLATCGKESPVQVGHLSYCRF